MDILARVNPRYFAAINLFAADRDVRYYLNGVYIDPHPLGGVAIVATNGHFMAAIHDPDGYAISPIIVGDITKQLVTACKSKGPRIGHGKRRASYLAPTGLYIGRCGAIVSSGEPVTGKIDPFANESQHLSKISIIDGVFPNYGRVIQKEEDRTARVPSLNAKYLATFAQAAEILVGSNKYDWGINLFSTGDTSSIAVRINGNPDIRERFIGLLMPLRGDGDISILPSWIAAKQEPAPAPAP